VTAKEFTTKADFGAKEWQLEGFILRNSECTQLLSAHNNSIAVIVVWLLSSDSQEVSSPGSPN
jgi:hypothetical protein